MITQFLKRTSTQILTLIAIVGIMSSCEKDMVQIDNVIDHSKIEPVQHVDENYFKLVEEQYLSTDEAARKQTYATFHNRLSDVKKFESQEDFELAAKLVNMKAALSDGKILVHENLKNLNFDYSTPDLASFFNYEGKLIVGNILYEIVSDTEQIETNLLTKEVTKTLIVEFEESVAKDDPTYESRTVSYKKRVWNDTFGWLWTHLNSAHYHIPVGSWESTPVVAGYGNVVKFRIEFMQRVWRSWGCRKGRAETNITHVWNAQGNYVQLSNSNSQEFCTNGYEVKAEVFNPRENGSGEGCLEARADCRRDKNTGVTSNHYLYVNGTRHVYFERD